MGIRRNVKIRTIKGNNNRIMSASVEYPARSINTDVPYIGSMKSISKGDSASYIFQRGIYMFKDKSTAHESRHPYIVFQSDDEIIDIVGITTFGITKVPKIINMIPIINRNCLCYINPHRPYYFTMDDIVTSNNQNGCDDFYVPFHSYLLDDDVFELLCDFYDKSGSGLRKSKSEFIANYLNYLYRFKEILKDKLASGDIRYIYGGQLTFKTSYDPDFVLIDLDEDDLHDNQDLDDDDDIDNDDEFEDDDIENDEDLDGDNDDDESSLLMSVEKETIELNLTDPDILQEITNIEDAAPDTVKLPRFVSKMSINDIKTFISVVKIRGCKKAAALYNTNINIINYKKAQLNNLYNITYV